MATFSFTRLSSGTVKVVADGDTYFIPGNCKVNPYDTLNRIIITDPFNKKIEMDSSTDTINIAGVQNTGTATEIAEDLATDIFFLASGGGAAAWGDITGTLSDQTDLNTALATKAGLDPINILAYAALGSSIKAETLSCRLVEGITSWALSDSQRHYFSIYLPKAATLTGVRFHQTTQGNYTADNYNGIGLYSYSGGTLTLVASSADNGNIWKGGTNTIQSAAFSSTYAAVAGIYYVLPLYNQSAQTTAPQLGAATALSNGALMAADFTNSAVLNGSSGAATTALPATQAMSGLSNSGSRPWFGLY
jgi:hypothetical protein